MRPPRIRTSTSASASSIDRPLPIGLGQTISQPFIVALMTELLDPRPDARVLEIGTGSGYQAAVLAECVAKVYTIEIVAPLGERARGAARARLQECGGANRRRLRWPEAAPFDAIIVTAAPDHIPQPPRCTRTKLGTARWVIERDDPVGAGFLVG